ncbi:MAG: DUF4760 domain-containing protein [Alphaproteobacteria bacterium]|jgi:hypothetical protein|nr:DUF4760 domain-containing protein [Alphaproteobacteria bacterium]|tara:strand:+ start:65 stop:676 length:612 start_codon:yes stop_codon:yes gene_type:complete
MLEVDRISVTIRFQISSVAIAFVLVLVVTGGFYLASRDLTETAVFFAAGLAGAGTILAALFTGRTLALFMLQDDRMRKRELDLDELGKKDRAMSFGRRWNDPNMYHVRNVCREIFSKSKEDGGEIKEYIEKHKTNVIHIMNFLEEIAYSVDHDLVDEELLKDQFDGIIFSCCDILGPWIAQHRKDRGFATIWIAVENLRNKWR